MYQTQPPGESAGRTDARYPPDHPWQRVVQKIVEAWPPERYRDVTVLAGVSGGADSVALLLGLNACMKDAGRGRLVIGHFNHRLRGESADKDQQFVQSLGQSLNLECVTEKSQRPGKSGSPLPSEAGLRAERYEFFERAANRLGARYVALAHNADDVVETVLHNLFRSTGLAGLSGIPPFRPLGRDLVIARPLLNCSAESIRNGLKAIGQPFCHDSTNDETEWNRNWLRNEILPLIESRYGEARPAILRAANVVRGVSEDLQQLGQRWFDEHCRFLRDRRGETVLEITRSAAELAPVRSVLRSALVIAWDRAGWPRGEIDQQQWVDLMRLILGETATPLNLPGDLRAAQTVVDSKKAVYQVRRA